MDGRAQQQAPLNECAAAKRRPLWTRRTYRYGSSENGNPAPPTNTTVIKVTLRILAFMSRSSRGRLASIPTINSASAPQRCQESRRRPFARTVCVPTLCEQHGAMERETNVSCRLVTKTTAVIAVDSTHLHTTTPEGPVAALALV